jgi:hypothetical protein
MIDIIASVIFWTFVTVVFIVLVRGILKTNTEIKVMDNHLKIMDEICEMRDKQKVFLLAALACADRGYIDDSMQYNQESELLEERLEVLREKARYLGVPLTKPKADDTV